MRLIWCNVTDGLFDGTVESIKNGTFTLLPVDIAEKIGNMLLSEIKELTGYIIIFFCLGVMSAVVNLMGDNLKAKVSEMSFFACFTLTAATSVQCFSVCLEYAVAVIGDMTDFITKLSPMLAGLIATSGAPVTAGAFHPVLMAAVYVVSIICEKCIVPLASYSVILSIANNLSDQVQISATCKLISSVSKWILALSFTLFAGICGIYGFSAPGLDAMSARTVKFAVGSLVPVVGGFLSDTLETVVTGGRMMKNTVGSAGIFVLCSVCAVPVIKIGMMSFIVRISSALVEPVSDSRVSKLLSDVSGAITILFGMVVTVAVLFIICISILLSVTSNA